MTIEAPWPVPITPLHPVSCGVMLWRSRGQLYATVVVKVTFAMFDEADMVLEEPEPILRAEVHHQNVPTRSIRASSDLVPYLKQAEVLVTGHACATRGPTPTLTARLLVVRGRPLIDKAVLVVGDRSGDGQPQPFERMPLMYERAYGGIGWKDNPFGVGAGQAGKKPRLPNLLDLGDPQRTTGFGPISRSWPARKQLADAEARKALEQPIPVVPDQLDWAYFQAAPPDQRLAELHGDEWIVLEGMHPTLPRIRARLPGVRAAARVHGLTDPSPPFGRAMDLRADTLRVDTDEQRCSLVWRGALPVRSEEHAAALHVVVALERPGATITWPEAPPTAAAAPAARIEEVEVDDNAATLVRDGDRAPAAPRPWVEVTEPLPLEEVRGALREARAEGTQALTPEEQAEAARHGELPFAKPAR